MVCKVVSPGIRISFKVERKGSADYTLVSPCHTAIPPPFVLPSILSPTHLQFAMMVNAIKHVQVHQTLIRNEIRDALDLYVVAIAAEYFHEEIHMVLRVRSRVVLSPLIQGCILRCE